MKNTKWKILFTIIFSTTVAILMIFGCSQQPNQTDPSQNDVIRKDVGKIQILIPAPNSGYRTLSPDFITPTEYEISAIGPAAFAPVTVTTNTKLLTGLAVGSWAITVKGKDVSGNVIASGSNSTTVIKDQTVNLTVDVVYLKTGTGTFDLTIDWSSSSVAINQIELKVDSDLTTDFSFIGSKVHYKKTISSGTKTFVFKLKIGEVAFANVIESVHIYDYHTTSAIITLNADDFKKAPSVAPGNLTGNEVGIDVTGDKNNKVVLYWIDNSYIETGFVVERKIGLGGVYEVIGTLSAGTETFEDLTVDVSVNYYYRVKAFNDFGSSPYSAERQITCVLEPPSASGVSISGEPVVGQVLTGVYTFSDPNDDSESGSLYRWLTSSTSGGTYSAISGATTKNYTVQSSDVGKYIKFEVTPKTAVSPNIGSPVLSDYKLITTPGDLTTDFDFN
ncbi:MAG TPA: hypothetical protein PLG34_12640 [Spirochaetota bacterium]|nr:MAG: hypothetical protein BWX91_01141 [Spirochaetes bacterium ADurb.Bin133]HNZ26370.1 hypothetical protein [Spirochaetota bacterium]HPY88819.1 hypothetical protein [Spirochaetota bacterium]